MYPEVLWKDGKKTDALGRNGTSMCIGIELMETEINEYDEHSNRIKTLPIVEISPLNTRGGVTRCHIDIPIESIPEIIERLQKINQREKFFVEKGEE
jgi:hypothetical protein